MGLNNTSGTPNIPVWADNRNRPVPVTAVQPTDTALAVEIVRGGTDEAAIDPNNSTTTPLLATDTFTGTATDVEGYSTAIISAVADAESAAGGVRVYTSDDGATLYETDAYD